MSPGFQLRRVNSVLVEALPLFKCILRVVVVLLVIPVEHLWRVLDSDTLAEGLDYSGRVVEEIVSIDDADLSGSLRVSVDTVRLLAGNLGSDLSVFTKVVEDTALLVIPGFRGHEVVETSHLIKRWNGAAVVAGDAVLGVTDQEGEVELLQNRCGDDGWVARLCLCSEWVWWSRLHWLSGLTSIDLGSLLEQRKSAVIVLGADTALH